MSGGEGERLQKILAAAGVASRRAAENLIVEGRVTVDGEVAHLGQRVDAASAVVEVDGERVNVDPERVYVLLNKPLGVVSTASDPEGRPTVVDLVNLPQRLFPVGRLDRDTEGLLLLTNDGELAHALTHPSFEVPRVYVALVRGTVRRHVLGELRRGVDLDDGPAIPRSVKVVDQGADRTLLEIVVTEGRNREVRRLVGAVGLRLERLARVAFDGVELGELRQGKWRFLTQQEIGKLHAAVAPGRRARRPSRAARPPTGGQSAGRQSGKSANRQNDRSVGGKPVEGKSVGGKSVGGKSVGGKAVDRSRGGGAAAPRRREGRGGAGR